jgi:two-component system chemotaxis response regulator CheB
VVVGEAAPDDAGESRAAGHGRVDERAVVLAHEVAMASVDETAHQRPGRYGVPSRFACPDCGGVLWDVRDEGPIGFRCETGHAYSPGSLAEEQTDAVERALWAALRALEDKIALADLRARSAADRGLTAFAQQFTVQQEAAQEHAAALRVLLRLDNDDPGPEPSAGLVSDPAAGRGSAG